MATKLDVGCGSHKKEGYTGIDKKKLDGVDVVLDLEIDTLPFPDSSVETIYCNHALEHVTNLIHVMNEFHRVLIHDGLLEIGVPSIGTYDKSGKFILGGGAFRDPTHVRYFTQDSFYYWVENYMSNSDYGIVGYFKLGDIKVFTEERKNHLSGVNLEVKMRTVKIE